MNQRTCNIIMCCKGKCHLPGGEGRPATQAIAAYMSDECGCPIDVYREGTLFSILKTAMFDYMNCADNPGYELQQVFYEYLTGEPTTNDRIINMFSLTEIRDKDGAYVNGFTEQLIERSRKALGEIANGAQSGQETEGSGND